MGVMSDFLYGAGVAAVARLGLEGLTRAFRWWLDRALREAEKDPYFMREYARPKLEPEEPMARYRIVPDTEFGGWKIVKRQWLFFWIDYDVALPLSTAQAALKRYESESEES